MTPLSRPPQGGRSWIGLLFPLALAVVLLGAVIAVPLLLISYNNFTQSVGGFCALTDPLLQTISANAEQWAAAEQISRRPIRFSLPNGGRGYVFARHFSGDAQTPVYVVIAGAANTALRDGTQGYLYLRGGQPPDYWTAQYTLTQITAQLYCYQS